MSYTIVIPVEAAERIVKLREAKGWKQKVLAAKARVAQPHLCRLEKGGHNTKWPTLKSICDALECEPRDILGADLPGEPDSVRDEIVARVKQLEDDKLPVLLGLMLQWGFERAAA